MIRILRGLPGSGKSTYAEKFPDAEVFSADSFHMIDGVYRYDPKRAGLAHSECFKIFVLAVLPPANIQCRDFIVDNTSTTVAELAPYVRFCEAFGMDYEILYFMCSVETALLRNTHGVPDNTILAMHTNLLTELVPSYWKQRIARK
jgi:predicted kinase